MQAAEPPVGIPGPGAGLWCYYIVLLQCCCGLVVVLYVSFAASVCRHPRPATPAPTPSPRLSPSPAVHQRRRPALSRPLCRTCRLGGGAAVQPSTRCRCLLACRPAQSTLPLRLRLAATVLFCSISSRFVGFNIIRYPQPSGARRAGTTPTLPAADALTGVIRSISDHICRSGLHIAIR